MQHNLQNFLRHGGGGQYVVTRHNGTVYGHRADISIKSLLPGYADMRAAFTDQLDRVIAENTRMLLNALTPPDTVPWVAEADLRGQLGALAGPMSPAPAALVARAERRQRRNPLGIRGES